MKYQCQSVSNSDVQKKGHILTSVGLRDPSGQNPTGGDRGVQRGAENRWVCTRGVCSGFGAK